uniref:Uncharacterized protein n=1 Tax=Prasinoderma singulare TaxID=676789 RepID=A0A7S3BNE1_9VIRI|mmetsp:Transcript_20685/g.64165  ORF Transcript_20685/g.64165 Transcript_20685/m.64165 type:complete len:275 (+) Transcript_20685:280-1104(+)
MAAPGGGNNLAAFQQIFSPAFLNSLQQQRERTQEDVEAEERKKAKEQPLVPSAINTWDESLALLDTDYEVRSLGTVKRLQLLGDVFVQACQRARAGGPRKPKDKDGSLVPLPDAYKEYEYTSIKTIKTFLTLAHLALLETNQKNDNALEKLRTLLAQGVTKAPEDGGEPTVVKAEGVLREALEKSVAELEEHAILFNQTRNTLTDLDEAVVSDLESYYPKKSSPHIADNAIAVDCANKVANIHVDSQAHAKARAEFDKQFAFASAKKRAQNLVN